MLCIMESLVETGVSREEVEAGKLQENIMVGAGKEE